MKFSTIIAPAFFALFIFTATATFAAPYTEVITQQTIDKEDVDNIWVISSRTLQVTDRDAEAYRSSSNDYTMHVKVMKNMSIKAQGTSNNGTVMLDLNDLEAGTYLCIVQTSTGTQRKFITIE